MMRAFTLSEIASATNGTLIGEDRLIETVSTDSRSIEAGALFVALTGDHFDGHDYTSQALLSGAAACLVSRQVSGVPCVIVRDTVQAYGELAKLNRAHFKGSLIALTGSAGKTTTKEMLAKVLSCQGDTLKTAENLNNTIGVPKTLIELNATHKFAVIEMGANAPGEIAFSVDKALPDISVILNASEAHTQGFGDLNGVVKAKGEILNSITSTGYAVLNADDNGLGYWSELVTRSGHKMFTFGVHNPAANLFAANIKLNHQGCAGFDLMLKGQSIGHCHLSVPGRHQVANALAVLSCCIILNIPVERALAAIKTFAGVKGRISLLKGLNGSTIYDDTYNASPASMVAAIDLLASLPGEHIGVLADMAELGAQSEFHHRQIAEYAVDNLTDVRLLGPTFLKIAPQHSYQDKQQLIDSLKLDLKPNINVLIKGANAMKMNEVVNAVVEKEPL